MPHSSDDDDRRYRTREEVEEWSEKDPLAAFARQLKDSVSSMIRPRRN